MIEDFESRIQEHKDKFPIYIDRWTEVANDLTPVTHQNVIIGAFIIIFSNLYFYRKEVRIENY